MSLLHYLKVLMLRYIITYLLLLEVFKMVFRGFIVSFCGLYIVLRMRAILYENLFKHASKINFFLNYFCRFFVVSLSDKVL